MWRTGHTLGKVKKKPHYFGTEEADEMLGGQLFGPGGNTTPERLGGYHSQMFGSMGGEYGPLEGATAEKAVPFLCAARRSFFVS
jgi:hypothetical protein